MRESIQKRFGFIVRTERSRLEITQEELGFRSGLHRTYITDVEGGKRNPSLYSISRISSALEISLRDLFNKIEGNLPRDGNAGKRGRRKMPARSNGRPRK